MKILLVTLVTVFCLQFSLLSYASQSQNWQSKDKEILLEKTNGRLNLARKEVQNVKEKINFIYANTDKTRKIIMKERQSLKRLIISAKKEKKRKSYEVNTIEKELIRARTKLKFKLSSNDTSTIQTEVIEIIQRKDRATRRLTQAKNKLSLLQSELHNTTLNLDPRIVSLSKEARSLKPYLLASKNKLYQLKKTVEKLNAELLASENKPGIKNSPPPQKTNISTQAHTYVYVISGSDEPNIESSLQLKDWVKSYGAKYIEGHWNNLYGGPLSNNDSSSKQFLEQFETELTKLPLKSKIILIGHGLGGGAVIKAATGIAAKRNRKIDLLVAIDPVGTGNLRANIVYETKDQICLTPKGDRETNDDYIKCIKNAKPRLITQNVAHFYNRWQKDAQAPLDYYKELMLSNHDGKLTRGVTSTGKFKIASITTKANQKREFYNRSEDAHRKILSYEANHLPNLLIEHLR